MNKYCHRCHHLFSAILEKCPRCGSGGSMNDAISELEDKMEAETVREDKELYDKLWKKSGDND